MASYFPKVLLIRYLMEAQGVTKADLANSVSKNAVSKGTMRNILKGKSVSRQVLDCLATELHSRGLSAKLLERTKLSPDFGGMDICYSDPSEQPSKADALIRFLGQHWTEIKKKATEIKQPNAATLILELAKEESWDRMKAVLSQAIESCVGNHYVQEFDSLFDSVKTDRCLEFSPESRSNTFFGDVPEFYREFLLSPKCQELLKKIYGLTFSDEERLRKFSQGADRLKNLVTQFEDALHNGWEEPLTSLQQKVLYRLCDFATWLSLPDKSKESFLKQIARKTKVIRSEVYDHSLNILHFLHSPEIKATESEPSLNIDDPLPVLAQQTDRKIRIGEVNFPESGARNTAAYKEVFIRYLARQLELANYSVEPVENLITLVIKRLVRKKDVTVVLLMPHYHSDKIDNLLETLEHNLYLVQLPKGSQKDYLDVIELRSEFHSLIKSKMPGN